MRTVKRPTRRKVPYCLCFFNTKATIVPHALLHVCQPYFCQMTSFSLFNCLVLRLTHHTIPPPGAQLQSKVIRCTKRVVDITLLKPGGIFPCNDIFISSHNATRDESGTTGDSDAIKKVTKSPTAMNSTLPTHLWGDPDPTLLQLKLNDLRTHSVSLLHLIASTFA